MVASHIGLLGMVLLMSGLACSSPEPSNGVAGPEAAPRASGTAPGAGEQAGAAATVPERTAAERDVPVARGELAAGHAQPPSPAPAPVPRGASARPAAPPPPAVPPPAPAPSPAPPARAPAPAHVVVPDGPVRVAATRPGLTTTGADKCGKCHKLQHTSWLQTAHAKLAHPLDCEACHGPGSEYEVLKVMIDPERARAAGLVMPGATFCVRCHVAAWDDAMLTQAHAHKPRPR